MAILAVGIATFSALSYKEALTWASGRLGGGDTLPLA
jgi:hypothetical protein